MTDAAQTQDAKQALLDDLTVAVSACVSGDLLEDVKMRIMMCLPKYDVTIAERALTVWDGDRNEMIVRRFLAAKMAKGCSVRTIEYYKHAVTAWLAGIDKNYDDITTDDIRLWIALRVQRDKVTKTTVNNERRAMSSFYSWLQKEEILLKNPMAKVDVVKETKVKKRAYSALDIERIRLACRTNRERALIEILASTWARISEVAQMRIDEIHDGQILVHGKGGKERIVYLNARAALATQVYLEERSDKNPYVFPRARYAGEVEKFGRKADWYKTASLVDEDGQADVGTLESIVRSIGRRAGLEKVHPHRFRRTGATVALRQGMPLTTVSKLLGHESIETTQIYLDVSDEDLRQAHEKYVN